MKLNFRSRKIVLKSEESSTKLGLKTSQLEVHKKLIPTHKKIIESVKEEDKKEESEVENQQFQTENLFNSPNNQKDFKQECLQARDRKMIVAFNLHQEKHFNFEDERQRINEWLGEMHFKVVSASFNLFVENELTYDEVKVHCSENLLLNILLFLESISNGNGSKQALTSVELSALMKQINETLVKNLDYMMKKYPLTKESKPNKALRSQIAKINNLGNDENDLIMKSNVEFKLKKQDSYTSEIMKFINYCIAKQSEPSHLKSPETKKDLTYFEAFYQTMEKIFLSVFIPQNTAEEENPVDLSEVMIGALFGLQQPENQKKQKQKKQLEDVTKQKELKQYKEKVSKYTHYVIGQKISSNTELYSESEIQSQIFQVKNASILRILTKWTEELEQKLKYAEQNILKRPFRFKKNKGAEFSKLNANQKNDLYLEAKRKVKEMNAFFEELKENYNQIQAMLGKDIKQPPEMINIPKLEYKIGYFCTKIQSAASSTLMSYLNKIIHILLTIPENIKENHKNDESELADLDVSLITFKIADLFRCRFKSKQAEIIRVFKQIKQIGEKGEPFKIIRIKDRLDIGTRDILINILFLNTFICQIQLAVQEYVETKQQSFNKFTHYIYELHRSQLGPVMESACIWAQYDQRSKGFKSIKENANKEICLFVHHPCGKQYLIENKYPFVCTLCGVFYSSQEGLIKHRKCKLCKIYYQCATCCFSKMNQNSIGNLLDLSKKLGPFLKDFKIWDSQATPFNYPKFGLLASRKMKHPQILFFQTIIFKLDAYLIRVKENLEIDIIYKIVDNSEKNWKKASEGYIIYEWAEKRFYNQTILPAKVLEERDAEIARRETQYNIKKEEKERKKRELEERRNKEEEERKANKKGKDFRDNLNELKNEIKNKIDDIKDENENKEQANLNASLTEKQQIVIHYYEDIAKRSEVNQFRVAAKLGDQSLQYLVLGNFLSESEIRNCLKTFCNKNILSKLASRKIEVLFVEDEYIHNQINEELPNLTDTEQQQIKESLERVNEVYFDNNFIEDISILSFMTSLKVAHLSNNKITRMCPLQKLVHLTELFLEKNQIYEITGLENKEHLIQLNLNRNHLSSLSQICILPKLKILNANDNEIIKLNGIEKLPNLLKLDLSFNEIEEIQKFEFQFVLEELDLSNNKIILLEGLQQFTKLKKLWLNRNLINVMQSSLANLLSLTHLQLNSNKIVKIQSLQSLSHLSVLSLNENIIEKMEGLDCLEHLTILNLKGNLIPEISNYFDLSSLVRLDLSFNAIQDLSTEDLDKYMPQLKQLNLNANPIILTDLALKIIKKLSKSILLNGQFQADTPLFD